MKHGLVFFDLIFFPFIFLCFSIIKICNNTHIPFSLMQKKYRSIRCIPRGFYTKLLLSWPIFFHVVQKRFDLWELHNEKKNDPYTHIKPNMIDRAMISIIKSTVNALLDYKKEVLTMLASYISPSATFLLLFMVSLVHSNICILHSLLLRF